MCYRIQSLNTVIYNICVYYYFYTPFCLTRLILLSMCRSGHTKVGQFTSGNNVGLSNPSEICGPGFFADHVLRYPSCFPTNGVIMLNGWVLKTKDNNNNNIILMIFWFIYSNKSDGCTVCRASDLQFADHCSSPA